MVCCGYAKRCHSRSVIALFPVHKRIREGRAPSRCPTSAGRLEASEALADLGLIETVYLEAIQLEPLE